LEKPKSRIGKIIYYTKAVLGFILFVTIILIIWISSEKRSREEKQIRDNPCYADCTKILIITGNKGVRHFEYYYTVNGIAYKGYSGINNDYVYEVSELKLQVKYCCSDHKISRLMIPTRFW
jgi:hypothetical protein